MAGQEQGPGPGQAGEGLSSSVEAFLRQAQASMPAAPGQPAPAPVLNPAVVAMQRVHLALALMVASYHKALLAHGVEPSAALVLSSQYQAEMLAGANAAVALFAEHLRRAAEGQQG